MPCDRTLLRRVLPVAALIGLAAVFNIAYAAPDSVPTHTVRLVIDYDDGAQKVFTRLKWTKDMTVEDALKLAKAAPHGITYDADGTGSSFFVKKIDDLKNEGAGVGKRNWQYWLNGQYAKQGAGTQKLQPDDVVLWRFSEYKPEES